MSVKDTLLAVSGLLGGPDGGGGGGDGVLELLASGTFTKVSGSALKIPVSYTGTPYYVAIVKDEHTADSAETIGVVRAVNSITPGMNLCWNFTTLGWGIAMAYDTSNAKKQYSPAHNSSNIGGWVLSADEINFARVNSTYPWNNGNYHWYIYGRNN